MSGIISHEINIFTNFLRDYNVISNEVFNQIPESQNISLSTHQENMYALVKEILYKSFISLFDTSNDIDFLQSENKNKDSFHYLKKNFYNYILEKLISKYSFTYFEENLQKNISPFIFSLLFENSLKSSAKQKGGIFFTSPDEVNFMCKEALIHYLIKNTPILPEKIIDFIRGDGNSKLDITITELNSIRNCLNEINILDPACGSGAFIIGMFLLLRDINSMLNHLLVNQIQDEELIERIISENLYGLDINSEALSICKLRLNFIKTYFTLKESKYFSECNQFNLYSRNAILNSLETIANFPKTFEIIIGNPPFIRQEQFVKQNGQIDSTFNFKTDIMKNLEKSFDQKVSLPKSLKSDFYIYFFYKGISLLKKGGVLCFISSNSWLDVKFGEGFKEILTKHFLLETVIINLTRKLFSASVNVAVTIIVKPLDVKAIATSVVRFVTLKHPFTFQLSDNSLQKIHISKSDFENDHVIVRTIKQNQLITDYKQERSVLRDKWSAKFFKVTPKILKIIKKIEDKLVPLAKLGKVRYSVKTGINEFFYLDKEKLDHFKIEEEFLIPVLKSPKKINRIFIAPKKLEKKLFLCSESKNELQKNKKSNALRYIHWGEKQETSPKQQSFVGIPWFKVPSVQNNKPYWYSVRKVQSADIFCNRFFDRRYFFTYANELIVVDQTFYGVILNDDYRAYKELIIALLNSTIVYLMLELFGRISLGKGALQYAKYEYEQLLVIDLKLMNENLKEEIWKSFKPLLNRDIKSIFDECQSHDRISFDRIIFSFLELDEEEIQFLYDFLISLVKTRLEKSGQKFP